MTLISRTTLAWMACLALAACGGGGSDGAPAATTEAQAAAPTEQAEASRVPLNAAMQIDKAGHGLLFDAKGQLIEPNTRFITSVQAAVREEVNKVTGGRVDDETQALLERADGLLADEKLSEADRLTLQGGMTWRLLQGTNKELIERLEWRLESANGHIQDVFRPGSFQLDPRVYELLLRAWYFDLDWRAPYFKSYAQRCKDLSVPVPPNFALKGTAWVHRGALSHNILSPGKKADVWSWADPARRGVCVALPREGGLAGIICQSAKTGSACFWDNIDATSNQRVDWQTQTLQIAKLKNGTNLSENCTACHRGNNVFLISPDDNTWAKLLRPLPGTVEPTLTTRVEASSDNQGGRPRYRPITGLISRPGWANVFNPTASCSSSCHETPPALTNPPPMPPACASLPGGCQP